MHTTFFEDSNRLVVSSADYRTNLMVVQNPLGDNPNIKFYDWVEMAMLSTLLNEFELWRKENIDATTSKS